MVTVQNDGDDIHLLLRPNRSLSWRGNQYLFLVILVWLGSFGFSFAAMGAWVILPFVGLELLALACALYYVSWKLSQCQVLRIGRDHVYIAKGRFEAELSWTFPRDDVVVHVALATHPLGSPAIEIIAKDAPGVRIGEFLNQDDCKRVIQQLVSARLATRRSHGRVRMAV